MRILMITAALVAVTACNRGGNTSANAAAGNKAGSASSNSAAPAAPAANASAPAAAAGGMPAGFPSSDPLERGLGCAGYLSVARQAGATPAGRDAPIMEQAEGQWIASLTAGGKLTEDQVEGQLAPIRQAMAAEPAAQRDAAAAWCVENAPEVDPDA